MKNPIKATRSHPIVFATVLLAVAVSELTLSLKYSFLVCLLTVVLIESIKTAKNIKDKRYVCFSCSVPEIVLNTIAAVVALFFWIGLRTFQLMLF